jgi:hypothetical protein
MPSPCVTDTDCFHLDDPGGALTVEAIISPDVDNGFECRPDGIWVPGIPPRTSVLPASGDYDGQVRAFYPVITPMDDNVLWMMRWDATDATWYFIGGPPAADHVNTAESITVGSGSWGGLATLGPKLQMPYPGHYVVDYGALINGAESGTNTEVGVALDGVDPVSGHTLLDGSQDQYHAAAGSCIVVVSGSLDIRLKYQRNGTATAATFQNRWLHVTPIHMNP